MKYFIVIITRLGFIFVQEKRTKAVVIGRLGPGDSFGESTVLKHVPMPWSVTADSEVELGTISARDVLGNIF